MAILDPHITKEVHCIPTDLRWDGDGTGFFAHPDDARFVHPVVLALRADLAVERDRRAQPRRNRHSYLLSGRWGSFTFHKPTYTYSLLPIFLKGLYSTGD